ncbi:cell adhesion molecule 2-like, partial [Clarias magur]
FCDCFSVTQTPSAVTLRTGEQVRLTCSWSISITGVKVRWFKDDQGFNQTSKLPKTKNIKDCQTLVIINAVRNDAGFYICEVTQDKPRLVKVNGTGTNVTYDRDNDTINARATNRVHESCPTELSSNTSQITEQISAPVLGTSVSLAVVILFVCVCLAVWMMKRSSKQSERMVIREGPPSEGEEPENSEDGGSSRTSRGSTQW